MIWSTLLLAFRALRRNSLRSALTMLGIVIGVAAVIAIVTLGSGASARVSAGVSSLGDRLLFVNPGTNLGGPQRGVTVRQFTMRDVEAIERDVSGVEAVSPTANTPVTAVYGNSHWPVNVTGITKDYFTVRNATLVRGAEFNEGQYQSGRLVCVIGKTVRETSHKWRRIACDFGSPAPTNTRNNTRATFVSRIAARCPKAKLNTAPAVYAPIPLNDRSVASSPGSSPPYRSTDSRAIACRRRGRMLYPSGRHV